jgi:hypothetical protein
VDGRGHHLAQRSALDDASAIHDGDAIGDLDRHADIVGDEDHRHAELALQFAQQQQDLDLDGGVERSGRLVCQQHLGMARKRQRDHGPLPHAAGHLVRIGVEPAARGGDAHALQHLERALATLAPTCAPVPHHGLGDLIADGVDGVERQHRLLEDHGGDTATDLLEPGLVERQHVLAGERYGSFDPSTARRQHAQQRSQRHALTRARLAKEAEHLALRQRDVDAVERVDRALAVEAHVEIADVDHRAHGGVGMRR